MKQSIKYLIFSLMVIAMLSSAAVAFAQGGQGGPGGPGGPGGHGAGGEVTAIDGSTIVVTNPHGDEESIITTDSTEFVVNDEAGSLDDIEVGMFVCAEGEKDDAGSFTATKVIASDDMPQPPDRSGGGQGGPGGPGGPPPNNNQ